MRVPENAFISWMNNDGVWFCTGMKETDPIGSGPSMLHARLAYQELVKNTNS